jgi:hypothetical protein
MDMVNKLVAAAATDAAAEGSGAWFEYSASGQTFKVKLARASGSVNPEFGKLQNELLKPYRFKHRGAGPLDIPPEKDREMSRELYSRTVVKDWNVEDVGVEFSPEAVASVMVQAPDFQDWVVNTSANADNFRKADIEAIAGN